MMLKDFRNNKLGFTLIEMIVSLGVFSMVVTTAVGAVLVLISTNQRLQGEHSVMTNLAFALDTMTRELRTGYKYYCAQTENIFVAGSAHESIIGTSTQDCPNGRASGQLKQGVSFYEGGNSLTGGSGAKRILYYYDTTSKTIMRRVGNSAPQSIVSAGLIITDAQFYVSDSNELSSTGDTVQPTVTIYIEAQDKDSQKTYYLQTTVAQRSLDI